MKRKRIFFSNSSMKELGIVAHKGEVELYDLCCPAKFKASYLDGKFNAMERKPSNQFYCGLFFETLALGGSAKGEKTEDFVRQKNGKQYAAEARIRKAARLFQGHMASLGLEIDPLKAQIPLVAKWGEVERGDTIYEIYIRGELDYFPVILPETNHIVNTGFDYPTPSIIDLKLTQDVNNTFRSGDRSKILATSVSCWGDTFYLDIKQALTYHWLVRNINPTTLLDREINPRIIDEPEIVEKYQHILTKGLYDMKDDFIFTFMVYSYGNQTDKPGIHSKSVVVEWSKKNQNNFNLVMSHAIDQYLKYENEGWLPTEDDKIREFKCKRCPIKDTCIKTQETHKSETIN